MGAVLLILLILLLLGAIPNVSGHQYGYGPSGLLGLLLVVLIVCLIVGAMPLGFR